MIKNELTKQIQVDFDLREDFKDNEIIFHHLSDHQSRKF
jgi:hypothetical protein